jgi:uncharacterized protein with NAD-binding domain and iron-sulfur cluster
LGEIEAQVCIVGGGIAGMTAAYRLQQAGVSCVVLEADSRLGGRIKTVEVGGCAFDVGAIGLLGSYTETVKLIDELGLKPKLSRAAVCLAIPRPAGLATACALTERPEPVAVAQTAGADGPLLAAPEFFEHGGDGPRGHRVRGCLV